MKHIIIFLSGLLTLIIVLGTFLSNKLSDLKFEKTNKLIAINQTLLDSHDKGFYAIGLGIDALGLLIERRVSEYNKAIDKANKSKVFFDSLYQKAVTDFSKIKEKDKDISRIGYWHSLLTTSSLVIAVLLLVFSLFIEKNHLTKKSSV